MHSFVSWFLRRQTQTLPHTDDKDRQRLSARKRKRTLGERAERGDSKSEWEERLEKGQDETETE